MFGRNKIANLVAEFLGTGILTLVILTIQRSTIGIPYFVAIGGGVAIAVLTVIFGGVSGAHFNPAITLALATARRIRIGKAILYIIVQFLGAWVAYYLYTYFVKSGLQNVGGAYSARILVAETFGTIVFAFGWAATSFNRFENSKHAFAVGAAYTIGVIIAAAASIGVVNPAVALGIRSFVWLTYVLGPVLGAIIGINLYGLLFAPVGSLRLAAVEVTETTVVASAIEEPVVKRVRKARKATVKAAPVRTTRVTTKRVVKKPTTRKK
jgi:glycerol uptake facilitator-like aquaporin